MLFSYMGTYFHVLSMYGFCTSELVKQMSSFPFHLWPLDFIAELETRNLKYWLNNSLMSQSATNRTQRIKKKTPLTSLYEGLKFLTSSWIIFNFWFFYSIESLFSAGWFLAHQANSPVSNLHRDKFWEEQSPFGDEICFCYFCHSFFTGGCIIIFCSRVLK